MRRSRGRCNPHVNWWEGVAQPRGYYVSPGMKGSCALLAHISEVRFASCKFLPAESSSHLQGRLSLEQLLSQCYLLETSEEREFILIGTLVQ